MRTFYISRQAGKLTNSLTRSIFIGVFVSILTISAAPPQRIVSTAPSATEMLFALGLGDRVVGVTTYCNYPAEAKAKPRIGTYLQPNFEAILALKPDLVVVVKNPVRMAERLSALGLRVLELSDETVPGIAESIRRIGDAAGVPDRAKKLNESMRAELDSIAQRTRSLPRRKMMFIVSRAPGRLEALMAVGNASFLNELIQIAGGENVFGSTSSSYPKVGLEEVLARNPDVIVDMGDMAETTSVSEQHKKEVVDLWKKRPSLKAARNNRVYAVASDVFVVPGPRAVEAAREFVKMLHPELKF